MPECDSQSRLIYSDSTAGLVHLADIEKTVRSNRTPSTKGKDVYRYNLVGGIVNGAVGSTGPFVRSY